MKILNINKFCLNCSIERNRIFAAKKLCIDNVTFNIVSSKSFIAKYWLDNYQIRFIRVNFIDWNLNLYHTLIPWCINIYVYFFILLFQLLKINRYYAIWICVRLSFWQDISRHSQQALLYAILYSFLLVITNSRNVKIDGVEF